MVTGLFILVYRVSAFVRTAVSFLLFTLCSYGYMWSSSYVYTSYICTCTSGIVWMGKYDIKKA